jgi:hypothetical protein
MNITSTCINSISLEFPVLQNKETYGIGYNCIVKPEMSKRSITTYSTDGGASIRRKCQIYM